MDREPHLYARDTYEDVTSAFLATAKDMGPNDLHSIDTFRLYDAITAFELGHPKMDTGASWVALKTELARVGRLETTEELIEVMDRLFQAEMAWHGGATFVQTVLSNLRVEALAAHLTALNAAASPEHEDPQIGEYLESRRAISSLSDVLDVYILALLKSAAIVLDYVQMNPQVVATEEDFHTDVGGFYILDQTPIDQVIRLLDAATKFVGKDRRLSERLALRTSWIHLLRGGVPKKTTHVDRLHKALEIFDEAPAATSSKVVDSMFSTGIQTRAPRFCLSRPLVSMELEKATTQFRGLIDTIRDLSSVYKIERSADLLGFFLVFASKKKLVLPRMFLKSLIGDRDLLGRSGRAWALDDIREVSYPLLDEIRAADIAKSHYEEFLSSAGANYLDLLTVFCQDRCWQREGLINCMASWDSLQVLADQLDEGLTLRGLGSMLVTGDNNRVWAFEFSAWVHLRKLQMMVWIVLMTFELELAQPWEFAQTYWYAFTLCEALQQQLGRLKAYFEQRSLRTTQPGYNYLVAIELEARCLAELCRAQFLVHNELQRTKRVPAPPALEFTSPELVFALRLQPFESVGLPQLPTYADYEAARARVVSQFSLPMAKSSLTAAQTLLSELGRAVKDSPEITLLKRSIMGLLVAVAMLGRDAKAESEENANGDGKPGAVAEARSLPRIEITSEGYHWYFPVPVVKT